MANETRILFVACKEPAAWSSLVSPDLPGRIFLNSWVTTDRMISSMGTQSGELVETTGRPVSPLQLDPIFALQAPCALPIDSAKPNRAGARLFLREIWPAIRLRFPDATLQPVGPGSNPGMRSLHGEQGVDVVGEAESVEPTRPHPGGGMPPRRHADNEDAATSRRVNPTAAHWRHQTQTHGPMDRAQPAQWRMLAQRPQATETRILSDERRRDQAGPLSGKLMQGAGLMVAMRWLMRILGIINIGILARILTPEDFGLIAMAMVVAGLIESFLNAGLDRAVLQRGGGTRDFYGTAWTMRLCQVALIAAAVAAAAEPTARYYEEPRVEMILLVVSLAALVSGFESLGIVLLRQQLRFKREVAFQVGAQLIGVIATILLSIHMRNYMAPIFGLLVKQVAQLILSYVLAPYAPRVTLRAWRELVSFSQWSLLLNLIAGLHHRLASLILGRIADADAVGRFSVSLELALTPTSEIAAPIMRSFFPGFVKLRDDRERFRSAFTVALAALALIGTAMCVGLALVASEFVMIVLGEKWLSVIPLVQIAHWWLSAELRDLLCGATLRLRAPKGADLAVCDTRGAHGAPHRPDFPGLRARGRCRAHLLTGTASSATTGVMAGRAAGIPAVAMLRCLVRPLVSAAVMSAGVLTVGHWSPCR